MRRLLAYFTRGELALWGISVLAILFSFFLFDPTGYLTLSASLIGVTSLLCTAKGHPAGQALMLIFSLLYGYISYTYAYYGEMITYLGMTAPMAGAALVSWLRHPHAGRHSEVAVGRLFRGEIWLLFPLTASVTVLFYFVLSATHTAHLPLSTLSVATSFSAVYLTFRRSPYYALAYAANDVVLLCLWTWAALDRPRYVSVVVCFVFFLLHDLYGFVAWRRMARRQAA